MNLIKVFLVILLITILTGCSTLYIPVSSEEVFISEGYGVIKTEDFILAVSNKYWIKDPQELTDYFITFKISIKNLSSEKIIIYPEDINLIDENGNQYDIVLPEEVMSLLVPEEILFDQFNQFEQQDDQVYETWKESKNNLIMDTYNFGYTLPNAQKTGYIFFPKLKSKNQFCKIVFKDLEIDFIREE